jgi:hypothetical protein
VGLPGSCVAPWEGPGSSMRVERGTTRPQRVEAVGARESHLDGGFDSSESADRSPVPPFPIHDALTPVVVVSG